MTVKSFAVLALGNQAAEKMLQRVVWGEYTTVASLRQALQTFPTEARPVITKSPAFIVAEWLLT